MEGSAAEFAARWYVLHRTVLDAPSLEFFHRHALTRAASGSTNLTIYRYLARPLRTQIRLWTCFWKDFDRR